MNCILGLFHVALEFASVRVHTMPSFLQYWKTDDLTKEVGTPLDFAASAEFESASGWRFGSRSMEPTAN